jgi:hypothetical protein
MIARGKEGAPAAKREELKLSEFASGSQPASTHA